jgi:hypothetical protein
MRARGRAAAASGARAAALVVAAHGCSLQRAHRAVVVQRMAAAICA